MTAVLHDWPYAALGLAAMVVAWLALEPRPCDAPPRWRDPSFVLPLLWPMYLVHQFEEHGIDALGHRFAFLADICAMLGRRELASCPADPSFIFAVNVIACPIAFALVLLFRRRAPLVAMFGWSVPMVNAFAHIGAAIVAGAYNPGLVTAVVLFLPLSAWMILTMLRAGVATWRQLLWLSPSTRPRGCCRGCSAQSCGEARERGARWIRNNRGRLRVDPGCELSPPS